MSIESWLSGGEQAHPRTTVENGTIPPDNYYPTRELSEVERGSHTGSLPADHRGEHATHLKPLGADDRLLAPDSAHLAPNGRGFDSRRLHHQARGFWRLLRSGSAARTRRYAS